MIVIIAGSRHIVRRSPVTLAFNSYRRRRGHRISTIVSGKANGPDTTAIEIAKKYHIHLEIKAADWDKYGKRAGFIRNTEMAEIADGLIAIWDGVSSGTEHMIKIGYERKLDVEIFDHVGRRRIDWEDKVKKTVIVK